MGYEIEPCNFEHKIFKNNLVLIDSKLPSILGEILLLSYSHGLCSIENLTKELLAKNPLAIDDSFSDNFYKSKIKCFLLNTILGLNPNKIWKGLDFKNQYLSDRIDGKFLSFNIYNRNQFEDYLFLNTRLETASSSRHKFGVLYKDSIDGNYYIKLNLQIRFK